MLVKQWLSAYTTGLPSAHHVRARVRQYRHDTLIAWRTQHIIASLPLALSISLMLFLAGLAIMLYSLSPPIAHASAVLIGITFVFHVLNFVLPAIWNCPWRTAISPIVYWTFFPIRSFSGPLSHTIKALPNNIKAFRSILLHPLAVIWSSWYRPFLPIFWPLYIIQMGFLLAWKILRWLRFPSDRMMDRVKYYMRCHRLVVPAYLKGTAAAACVLFVTVIRFFRWFSHTIKALAEAWWDAKLEAQNERDIVWDLQAFLDARAIMWLMHTSTKNSVIDHSVQALAGLPAGEAVGICHQAGALVMIRHRLRSCYQGRQLCAPLEAELYARALLRIHLLFRVLHNGQAANSRVSDMALARALTSASEPSNQLTPADISCMCAGAMLHEIVDIIERHVSGTLSISPFYLTMLVETFGQEIAWRKRSEDEHWINEPLSGDLRPRVLSLLIRLLNVESSSWHTVSQPLPLDISIAFAIAMITRGHPAVDAKAYFTESKSEHSFLDLVLVGLSPILHFPRSFGCDRSLLTIARSKYLLACRKVATRPQSKLDPTALTEILRSLPVIDTQSQEDILLCLSRMDKHAMRKLDIKLLLQLTEKPNLSDTFRFHLLVCLTRLATECSGAQDLVSSDAIRRLRDMMGFIHQDPSSGSHVFRVLGIIADNICNASPEVEEYLLVKMIDQGLLDVMKNIFQNPVACSQEDINRWVAILSVLCHRQKIRLVQSGGLQALIEWSQHNWRGRELTFPHTWKLKGMASDVGVTFPPDDTRWFESLGISNFFLFSKPYRCSLIFLSVIVPPSHPVVRSF